MQRFHVWVRGWMAGQRRKVKYICGRNVRVNTLDECVQLLHNLIQTYGGENVRMEHVDGRIAWHGMARPRKGVPVDERDFLAEAELSVN